MNGERTVHHRQEQIRQRLSIRSNDRLFFCGRVGSGKTTLARALLSQVTRFVVLDPKHDFRPFAGCSSVGQYSRFKERQIVRAPFGKDEDQIYEDAIEGAWQRRDGVIYIDEATLLTPPRYLPEAFGKAIRTGRSRGVGVWVSSQRPKELPSAIFTEAEHFFLFQLTYKGDRDKVIQFTSSELEEPLAKLQGHECIYYNMRSARFFLVRGKFHASNSA